MNTVKTIALSLLILSVAGCGLQTEPLVSSNPITSATVEEKPVPVLDSRSVWTVDQFNRSLEFTECKNLPVLRNDVANIQVPYKNQEFGIEMMVPYNEKWGTDEYKIVSAEVVTTEPTGNFVGFGPLLMFGEGGCTYIRDYRMDVVPKRDKAGVIAALKANKTIGSDQDVLSYKEEPIGDKQAMVYSVSGLCEQFHYEVKGPKNNYVFSTFCSDNVDDGGYLRGVIQSLKFI